MFVVLSKLKILISALYLLFWKFGLFSRSLQRGSRKPKSCCIIHRNKKGTLSQWNCLYKQLLQEWQWYLVYTSPWFPQKNCLLPKLLMSPVGRKKNGLLQAYYLPSALPSLLVSLPISTRCTWAIEVLLSVQRIYEHICKGGQGEISLGEQWEYQLLPLISR